MTLKVVSNMDYQFDFSQTNDWKNYLSENGFVVITGIIGEDLIQEIKSGIYDCLEDFSQGHIDRNKPETMKYSKNYPYQLHGGMIQYLGHSDFQWKARIETKKVFEEIWDTSELYSSFDGLCFMGQRRYMTHDVNAFIHCDQNGKKNFLSSIQGVLNVFPNGENDGGFVCIPGSHKIFYEMLKSKDYKGDWYKFSDEEKKNELFKQTIKVDCPAGGMILWDSRTFHANTTPNSQSEYPRACLYICMVPKSHIRKYKLDESDVINKRISAYHEARCTNHHPILMKCFPQVPRYVLGDQKIHYERMINKYHKKANEFYDSFKDMIY